MIYIVDINNREVLETKESDHTVIVWTTFELYHCIDGDYDKYYDEYREDLNRIETMN